MPTGTGKSGVIALAAQRLVRTGDILLLTPWDALVEQLARDVESRFFERTDIKLAKYKPVLRLLPSKATALLSEHNHPTIWISTTSTINDLHEGSHPAYAELQRRLRLVVVDEGHYEPAKNWSLAVRELGRPTILFTATPYRNDFKYFKLDPDFEFHFSHDEAERSHYLRAVDFEEITFRTPKEFCSRVIPLVDRSTRGFPTAKVIIRCNSRAEIQEVVAGLRRLGQSAVGIHEKFETGSHVLRRTVPTTEQCSSRYWVHQFKLTEGIDSADFRIVAFYRSFSSERAFVQQVGRVLRNPQCLSDERAMVIYRREDRLDGSWRVYRAYDLGAVDGLAISPLEMLAAQPPPLYFDGKFRNSIDLVRGNVEVNDLVFSRTGRICRPPSGFDLDSFSDEVDDALNENDCLNRKILKPREDTRVHVYLSIKNSPLLARDAFYQTSLGVTTYRLTRGYLFFNDTYGQRPERLDDFRLLPTRDLQRLFSGSEARLASVTLSNTDLSASAARSRSLRARNIDGLGPDLSDHAFLATTASGYHQDVDDDGEPKTLSRYVGFTRGRVSDRGSVDFDEYIRWQDDVVAVLRNTKDTSVLAAFDRYAEVIDRPDDVTPRSILLDFEPSDFVDLEGDEGTRLDIDDICLEVNLGSFICTANGDEYTVGLSWSQPKRRYVLSSSELDQRFVAPGGAGSPASRTLIGFFNREQAFRVVPEIGRDDYCIYTSRRFCRPRLPLGPRTDAGNPALLQLLIGCSTLGSIGSEKGEPGSATSSGWEPGSLFNLIDELGRGSALEPYMRNVDVLICDDGGSEIADFIAVDTANRRVIAIHAKASREPRPLSASVLHEVTAQATKNLVFFEPYFVRNPKNLSNWARPWRSNAGTVDERVRRGSGTPTALWNQIRQCLRDPQWTREVWIVVGHGPSRHQLEAECRRRTPKAEVVQILYSLQSTWSSVQAVGNTLRVFTSE
jgi:hypothetical protein